MFKPEVQNILADLEGFLADSIRRIQSTASKREVIQKLRDAVER